MGTSEVVDLRAAGDCPKRMTIALRLPAAKRCCGAPHAHLACPASTTSAYWSMTELPMTITWQLRFFVYDDPEA